MPDRLIRPQTTLLSERLALAVLLCVITGVAGCASWQDFRYENRQRFRSIVEYQRSGDPGRVRYRTDYKRGWTDGFYESITGGPDCPPAFPPNRYWNPKQILKDADLRRQCYYSGWQDGAARAASLPDTHFLRVFETPDCPMPRCDCQTGDCNCAVTTSPPVSISDTILEIVDRSQGTSISQSLTDQPIPDWAPANSQPAGDPYAPASAPSDPASDPYTFEPDATLLSPN